MSDRLRPVLLTHRRRSSARLSHAAVVVLGIALAVSSSTSAEERKTVGKVVKVDASLADVLDENATMNVLAEGFEWTEGPLWMTDDGGYLLYSEIPSNTIRRWSAKDGDSVWMTPSGYTGVADYGREPGSNGLNRDQQGRIVMCEHGDRRVSVLTPDGGKMTLVDQFESLRLNSPNDLVVATDGAIYFTDPPYGLPDGMGDDRQELDFCGVYRLGPEGTLKLLTREFARPNGIAISPDGSKLYVAQSDPKEPVIKVFDRTDDGDIRNGKVFHDFSDVAGQHPGLPDGMAIDSEGRLFATGPGGVWIFEADGTVLGRLDTGEATSNCAFGGSDGSDLFITADMYVLRIKTKTTGYLPF